MTLFYIDIKKHSPLEVKRAEKWAKKAAGRILSHWTEEELETMRRQNQAIKLARRGIK